MVVEGSRSTEAVRHLVTQQGKYPVPVPVELMIHTVRGLKVILDADLARIYEVEIKRLNEQVKRNADRFPDDFMFQLAPEEWEEVQRLRSQNATLKSVPKLPISGLTGAYKSCILICI
jgi:hypothetical protein